MKEDRKKREWIKSAAIVFLTIMLILTFFSQTIMNYSLPEVATQTVQSGSITSKVRGNGTVESGDPYKVMVKETKKVSSIAVRVGSKVKKGDVLMYLAEGDSTELTSAREALDDANDEYQKYLMELEIKVLKGEMSQTSLNNAQSGNIGSMAGYQSRVLAASTDIETKEALVKEAENKLKALKTQQSQLDTSTPDTSKEEQAVAEAEAAYKAVEDIVKAANAEIDKWQTEIDENKLLIADYLDKKVSSVSGNEMILVVSKEEYDTAVYNNSILEKRIAAKNEEIKGQNEMLPGLLEALNNAKNALDKKSQSNTQGSTNVGKEITNWENELNKRMENLEEAKTAKEKLLTEITDELSIDNDLVGKKEDIAKLAENVAKLEAAAGGSEVLAEIDGTVTEIKAASGKEVSAAEEVMVLQPADQGYTMKISITNEQAKAVSVGDRASLINSWYYDDMDIVLKSIKPDKTDPAKKKELTFEVSGEVISGQNLSISVGQKSANYDTIVPNSAIREDNNGKFVLIVDSKSSPLGNRYIATRVDVQVLGSDDTQSAVSGALTGWEYVITNSTKPVEAGKQVRLAD